VAGVPCAGVGIDDDRCAAGDADGCEAAGGAEENGDGAGGEIGVFDGSADGA